MIYKPNKKITLNGICGIILPIYDEKNSGSITKPPIIYCCEEPFSVSQSFFTHSI